MLNEALDERILVESAVTVGGIVIDALPSIWRSFPDSAAMYGVSLY